ncbi:MAG TPA: dihydrodipicolinate synthase family protein [Stellaceae bacterium]|nr:dihydrodipicolinate synthase family protein [Stellaceae bacterium]
MAEAAGATVARSGARDRTASGKESAARRIAGVLSPVVTPFRSDLSVDAERLLRHCRWLVSQNCGLAVFGTNSEANSLGVEDRMLLLDTLIEGGIDPRVMMPGTGCCALTDSVKLTAHAVKYGCAGVLMLPPFYYKGVSDDGLFRNFAEVIERVGDARLRVYLYHIPPVSQVPITLNLIERLLKAYPGTVAGLKDSSGDWSNTEAVLKAFHEVFDVFAGSEAFLLPNMRNGGTGCISATANINPAAIHALYLHWKDADADERQAKLNDLRFAMQKFPMIPALKHTVARFARESAWQAVRPPLAPLTREQSTALDAELDKRGFTMPGWPL